MADRTDDDAGYAVYEETTIDPGPSLLIATTLLCLLLYALLPCMVSLGRQSTMKSSTATTANTPPTSPSVPLTPAVESTDGATVDDEHLESRSLASNTSRASAAWHAVLDGVQLTNAHQHGHRRRAEIERRLRLVETRSLPDHYDETVSIAGAGGGGGGSALGKLDHDEVSFQDAVDARDTSGYHVRVQQNEPDDVVVSRCCGFSAGGKFGIVARSWDQLLAIAEWDAENKRLWSLTLPFMMDSMAKGAADVGRAALIGRFIGTSELTAYVMVDLLVGFTTHFIGGLHESLVTLCSHSIGSGNNKLTGQYLQITMILYVLCAIPVGIFWVAVMDGTLQWFGFDEQTAQLGAKFVPFFVIHDGIEGITETLDNLMDVTDHEVFSTVYGTIFEVLCTVTLALWAALGNASLTTVGYIYVVFQFVYFVGYVAIVGYMGWCRPYYSGLVYSFALSNSAAVKKVLSTSAALSLGYLLTYGEWEILAIFASFLGPAEVAAWSLMGTLWDALEGVTESVADASEVRCAYLLGSGKAMAAKLSSYKSILLSFLVAFVLTSALFIAGDDLSIWLTTDATLQSLVAELIPLFGIGNIALTLGTMAWTLVGAQGRYRLSTSVGFAGSWFVTIPLAAIFSAVLDVDLQGQTAAVVIGYMVSGTINTYFLLTSDWELLSSEVIKFNREHDVESDESVVGGRAGSQVDSDDENILDDASLSGRTNSREPQFDT